jgi:hypothetical protein
MTNSSNNLSYSEAEEYAANHLDNSAGIVQVVKSGIEVRVTSYESDFDAEAAYKRLCRLMGGTPMLPIIRVGVVLGFLEGIASRQITGRE